MDTLQPDQFNTKDPPVNRRELNLFDASVILTAITVYVYFCTFEYEKGYCSHFDIPTYLIEPSLNSLLGFGSVIFATVILSIYPIGFLLPIFKYSYENAYWGRVIKMNAVLLLGAVVIATTFPWNLRFFIWIGSFFILANFASWGYPYLLSIGKKDPVEKAFQITKYTDDFNVFAILNYYVRKEFHLIIIVAFMFPLFLALYGQGKASSETQFQYINGHPDLIVVRKYGELLVCKKINLKQKIITNTTILIKSTENSTVLISKMIGPF